MEPVGDGPRRTRPFPAAVVAIARRAGIVGVAILVALVLIEIALRLLVSHPLGSEGQLAGMYTNDGQSSYRLTPGYRGRVTIDGRELTIHVNAAGMRGAELPPERPDQVRILCLGDSFVFGYGVDGEETYPSRLAEHLRGALGTEVVAGNAGVPGHGTVDMVRMFEHYRQSFAPDLVTAAIYLGNDFEDDFVPSKVVVQGNIFTGPAMPGPWARTLQTTWRGRLAMTSRLAMQVEWMLISRQSSWALAPQPTLEELTAFSGFPPEPQRHAGLFMDAVDQDHFRDEATGWSGIPRILARVEESLRALRDGTGAAPLIVLLLPTHYHVDEGLWSAELQRLGLDPGEFRFGLAQERLAAICERLQLPWIDFTATARAQDDPQSVFLPVNKHLDPGGHRLLAGQVGQRIGQLLSR